MDRSQPSNIVLGYHHSSFASDRYSDRSQVGSSQWHFWGESLSASMAQAYCDGFQTSGAEREIKNGWGYGAVNAMVKHWPGGGLAKGAVCTLRKGKYAVYPSGKF
ncbi:MAG: hypothetical protein IPK94_05950 [Saprospiraceae bacterium]|nr:hypothetical protein [Saprospiraceae bacterium]